MAFDGEVPRGQPGVPRKPAKRTSHSRLPLVCSDAWTANAASWSRALASASTYTVAPSVHAGSPVPADATCNVLPESAEAGRLSRPTLSVLASLLLTNPSSAYTSELTKYLFHRKVPVIAVVNRMVVY